MDKIEQEIEKMAEKLTKASQTDKDKLFSVIKSLGKDGLKARLPFLSDEDKEVLKAAIQEMSLQKAVSMEPQAAAAKFVQGKITDTIIQEDKADDNVDETLVKPEAANFDHQGTPTDGWEGQVIKALAIPDEEFEKMIAPYQELISAYPDDFSKAYEGFKKLKGELAHKKGVSDPGALAAAIGRKKYGKGKFQHAAAEGKKMKKAEEFWNEVIKSDELLSDVVSKMMDKCGDSGMVMDKLAKKGADKQKVQGALDKYKMKKAEGKDPKEKLIQMEEKEHGTKDPKKLLAAEKREKMKKAIEKAFTKAMQKAIEKADKILAEEDQLGDAPNLEVGGQNKSGVKKEDVPALNTGAANKQAQEAVNDLSQGKSGEVKKADTPAATEQKVKKSVSWEGQDRLLKTHILGRNFNFNVEQFIDETLKNEPKTTTEVKKSETEKKPDINDLIEKSQDTTWDQLDHERLMADNAKKVNGKVTRSFNETDIADILNLSPEETKKILG